MERIASFSVNHDLLDKGMYISRVDGDVHTYDIRMKCPNGGDYLENAAVHSFEHLFATVARNGKYAENILYIGPMGCRTGFYLLTRGIGHNQALELVRESFGAMAAYSGPLPGAARAECGNYREHDLPGAVALARGMAEVLVGWTTADMLYKQSGGV